MDSEFKICVSIKICTYFNQRVGNTAKYISLTFSRLEEQGKEGNGKYEQCPVEDYVFKLEIIQCLLESPNKTVICEDSKLN